MHVYTKNMREKKRTCAEEEEEKKGTTTPTPNSMHVYTCVRQPIIRN